VGGEMTDVADKEAKELLPHKHDCAYLFRYAFTEDDKDCPAFYRPAVAARIGELQSQLAAANAEVERLAGKGTAAGPLAISLAEHVRRCEVSINEEQFKISPNNVAIAALCDSIRLVREYIDTVRNQLRTDNTEVELYKNLWEQEKEVYAASVQIENDLRAEVERLKNAALPK
jgi:hypothetical protein